MPMFKKNNIFSACGCFIQLNSFVKCFSQTQLTVVIRTSKIYK